MDPSASGAPTLSSRGTALKLFLSARANSPASETRSDVIDGSSSGADALARFFEWLSTGAGNHDLSIESFQLAEEVLRMAVDLDERQQRALAVALVASIVATGQGSTRLPLGGGTGGLLERIVDSIVAGSPCTGAARADLLADIEGLAKIATTAEIAKTTQIATTTRGTAIDQIVGTLGDYRPLVVHDGCLYQQRMLRLELEFVRRMATRLNGTESSPMAPSKSMRTALAEVVASAAFPLSDEQYAAVLRGLTETFTLITGGPGTGKTAIILSLLRTAIRIGVPIDAIALCAPTGKAVNRMGQSVRSGLDSIRIPSFDDASLREAIQPQTLHRLIGYNPAAPRAQRFYRHENNPISAQFIIVDEASMVDLRLMERLLRALRPDARVVMLGDAEQLPSVDAGAVLRDLVAALPENTCRLTRSYRMNPADPAGRQILTCAARVNRGQSPVDTDPMGRAEEAEQIAEEHASAVTLVDTEASQEKVTEFLDHWYQTHIAANATLSTLSRQVYSATAGRIADGDVDALNAMLARFQTRALLTATRRFATGSEAINQRMHEKTLARASTSHAPGFYPGEPVMMRANDYLRGLFNGDQGVIARVAEDGGEQTYRAVFPTNDGLRVFRLDALRAELDLAYAMTVHKSQGSELDHVALIMPNYDLPLLSRELLYTAITRARRSVTLVGSPSLLRIAAARTIERHSGIGPALKSVASSPSN